MLCHNVISVLSKVHWATLARFSSTDRLHILGNNNQHKTYNSPWVVLFCLECPTRFQNGALYLCSGQTSLLPLTFNSEVLNLLKKFVLPGDESLLAICISMCKLLCATHFIFWSDDFSVYHLDGDRTILACNRPNASHWNWPECPGQMSIMAQAYSSWWWRSSTIRLKG